MKLFTSLLLIGVAFGVAFIYIKPAYIKITEVRRNISEYDSAIKRAQQVVAKRDELMSRRQSFSSKDVDRLQKFLPDNVNEIRLVMEINNIALQYTSGIKNVKISDAKSSRARNSEASVGGALYEPVLLSFSISLSYEQFLKFAADLEKNLHLTDVTSLSFAPSQDSSIYDYSVTLSTYVLK